MVPKHSHRAVERNRVKRRLRELLRVEFLPYLGAVDLVIRAAPAAYDATFEQLRDVARRARETILAAGVS